MVLHARIVSWMKYFRSVIYIIFPVSLTNHGMHCLVTYSIILASYQVYEARLFRLNKSNNGEVITSVEEAVDMQKKQSALNQFYWNLSRDDRTSDYQDNGKKRELMEKVTVRCCNTCQIFVCH